MSESTQDSSASAGFTLDRTDGRNLRLAGTFDLAHGGRLWAELSNHAAKLVKGDALDFDLASVDAIDGGAMALLASVRSSLRLRGVECELVGATERVQTLIHLYLGDVDPKPRKKRRPRGTLDKIGVQTRLFFGELQDVLGFLGSSVLAAFGLLKEPRTGNWKEVLPIMEHAGADAIPIVLLINFLVGFVMAFQGAVQLKQFGANIYVADLVGLSVTRELGPLMTSIIVCGRSGAAFAAELGTMKVSEEIDALRTLGFGPIRFLVLPRVLGLVLVMPFLTLFADLLGVLGGLAVGLTSLDLTISGYLIETQKVVAVWDVSSGLLKSVVFGAAIALISCQQGFATTGGAEGVGRRTTSSVVAILFALILLDAGFTVFFNAFHL